MHGASLLRGFSQQQYYFYDEVCTNDTRFCCNHALRFGLRVANLKLLTCALAFVLASTSALAGFSSMRPPPGYSRSSSGATQQPGWGPTYKPAPGEFYDLGKQQWMTSASLNTGGRELTVPVAMPLATAGGIALSVATAFSSNPAILVATAVFALYQTWLDSKKIQAHPNGTFTQIQEGTSCASGCVEYAVPASEVVWASTPTGAAQAYFNPGNFQDMPVRLTGVSGNTFTYEMYYTNSGGYWQPASGTITTRPIPPYNNISTKVISPSQVGSELASIPMPPGLQEKLPYPLPVKNPVLNPGSNGLPQVLRVPQGSPSPVPLPSPNPENLPQSWKTPVVDIIPSPTPDDPWRVETIPKDIIKTNPTPITDPYNPPTPGVDPVTPTPAPTDPGTTEQAKQPGLCEEYPDILACAKPDLDTPEGPELETQEREITYAPQTGWAGGGGACPAPRQLKGVNAAVDFELACDFMRGMKPIMLAMASLVAGFIIIGARGGGAE